MKANFQYSQYFRNLRFPRNLFKLTLVSLFCCFFIGLTTSGFGIDFRFPQGNSSNVSDDPVFLYNQAMTEYSLRQFERAKECLEKFIKLYPKHQLYNRVCLELGRILIDQRNHDKAIELLTPIAELPEPNSERYTARKLLISAIADLQRFRQGVELLEKWRSQDPSNVEIGRSLADFYLQSGKLDEARLLLEGLLERTLDREVFSDLLKLAGKTGQIDSLMGLIEQRKARYRTADYLEFMSSCLVALKKDEKAAELLRSSPETRNSVPLLQKLARLDLDKGKYEFALKSYRDLQSLGLSDWENTKAIGHCLFLLGRVEEAIKEWKKPIDRRPYSAFENYNQYTQTLIEHKLYDQALEAFSEARRMMSNPAQFASERAGVLDAMGRHAEALDEYFLGLTFGNYTVDVFEKLFKPKVEGFDFKKRLEEAIPKSHSPALKRALVEIYFRQNDPFSIPEILKWEGEDDSFDDLLEERIGQANAGFTSIFTRKLMVELIKKKRSSGFAYKLAIELLKIQDQTDSELDEARKETEETVSTELCPDILLKTTLLTKFSAFLFQRCNDPLGALRIANQVLAVPNQGQEQTDRLEALVICITVETALGNFDQAKKELDEAKTLALDPEDKARMLVEEARLEAYKGEFQESLKILKVLTDKNPDSLWLNDGLNLALVLTAFSNPSLGLLKSYLDGERAASVGSFSEAIKDFELVASAASGTPLMSEALSRKLIVSEKTASPPTLLLDTKEFISKNPAHHSIPDLLLMEWRLMRKLNYDEATICDILKDFLDRFPGDLRARVVSANIEEIMKRKSLQDPRKNEVYEKK
ncbi:MAG: tetratricopeptide repeat protein [Candidatus Riflebacteria bacterium]|nr:tetratricopeptide repeat protein [Candidatus Riflebacteria bacterium]